MKNKLAILGGKPIREEPFPKYPVLDDEDKRAVMAVLDRGELSTFGAGPKGNFAGGQEIRQFERNFSKFNDSKYSLCVNSATAGLHCALAAVGVGPGDEVIVPPYTFTSTATSVLMHNAVPIFCDITKATLTIDPNLLEDVITEKTKAIIPVHLFGHPADMKEIMAIAAKHDIFVIEDCAQAPGAEHNDVKVGNIGHLGVFSFQETKNLPCGEGGMITTNNERLAERCKMIRNHGETIILGKPRSYISNIIGWNYRMTEMEAALGNSHLNKLEQNNETRRELFEYLRTNLAALPGLTVPVIKRNVRHAYHVFCMQYDKSKTGVKRDTIINAIAAEGIPVGSGYRRPLYANPIFQDKKGYGEQGCPFKCNFYSREIDYSKTNCKVAESMIYEKAIWIFTARPPATAKDMQDICDAFNKVWNNLDQLKGNLHEH